ncbi:MAG: four helix bundle protein, partial [Acidimicrobiia bacterium]|nr:four helix bundle protein [Acidimicrobiia bacterium]
MHQYERLKVWQRAIDLCRDVYGLSTSLPADERFGLTSQMRRAAISIAANIAEGCAARTEREFRRFLRMALGSAYELDTHFVVAREIRMLDPHLVSSARSDLREIRSMIVGLSRAAV